MSPTRSDASAAAPAARGLRRRLGVYGGSFDPVHAGHLALARTVLDALTLDEVWWIPAGQPWQKARALAPAADRAAMVALAIAGEPRFRLDRREIDRPGPSYTLDSVREIASAQPGAILYLLLGADQYARLPTWHGVTELLERVTLAVVDREGAHRHAVSARRLPPHRLVEVPMAPVPVSSTAVRAAVAQGAPLGAWVPADVASYIARHDLYKKAP